MRAGSGRDCAGAPPFADSSLAGRAEHVPQALFRSWHLSWVGNDLVLAGAKAEESLSPEAACSSHSRANFVYAGTGALKFTLQLSRSHSILAPGPLIVGMPSVW